MHRPAPVEAEGFGSGAVHEEGRHRLSANFNGDWGDLLGAFNRLTIAQISGG